MGGKMKWDRVRSENRAHLHVSEHIDAASQVLTVLEDALCMWQK